MFLRTMCSALGFLAVAQHALSQADFAALPPPVRPPVIHEPVERVRRDLGDVVRSGQLQFPEQRLLEVEKSLDALDVHLSQIGGKFQLHREVARQLGASNLHADKLIEGLRRGISENRLRASVSSSGVELRDGTSQTLDVKTPPQFESRPGVVVEHAGSGPATISWKWKWWGIKVRFTHKAAFYMCSATSYVLGVLNFSGWIELILKNIACLFHNLDTDNDGITLSITWIGAFWLNDSSL